MRDVSRALAGSEKYINFAPGEMAEWSIAAVLKTVEVQASGGSNPSLSAKAQESAANSGVFNFQQNESLLSVLREIENIRKRSFRVFLRVEAPP